jgi:peptidyl-prolyl cis-trans isomerase B (cyclophilin B)
MSTIKDRQRAAARARLEREMAERAAQAKQRRKQGTIIASAVAGVVVLILLIWLIVAVAGGSDKKPTAAPTPSAPANAATCNWLPDPDPSASPAPAANPNLKDVGKPPTTVPNSGDSTMTITTNQGTITATLDVAKAPCASASLAYLASKGFYNNTTCHRLTTQPFYVLQCGDPSATGQGGPTYSYATENLPTGKRPTYVTGDIAIAHSQAENSNGSQFFIVYQNTPDGQDDGSGQPTSALPADYTVVGHVTAGIEAVQKVGAGGVAGDSGDGKPKIPVNISSLAVTAPATPSAAASASPVPSAS